MQYMSPNSLKDAVKLQWTLKVLISTDRVDTDDQLATIHHSCLILSQWKLTMCRLVTENAEMDAEIVVVMGIQQTLVGSHVVNSSRDNRQEVFKSHSTN
ncbi:hypothetical protein PsorP6_008028 [Peronosclerospora sorghi]|uniref:Uncharacterized protein n=1 Tax=Peronosclerospora sorghi TaxID=230839 RepID=A0ACC0WAB8_9STRA|nr:hypothetical protein PsorP6_008028 [Peronosclerospora sorghi]